MSNFRKMLMMGPALVLLAGPAAVAQDQPGGEEGAAPADIMEREFNVIGSWSTSNLYPDYEKPFWNETLPEASGGKLTARLQAFDQVGLSGDAVYDLVSQGVYDAGATVIDYVAGDEPRVEGLDVPAIADPTVARAVADAYRPYLEQIFQETYDAQLLAVVPYSSQVVFCNTPIEGVQDLEGKRIRGSGRMTLDFIEAVGGTAVSISFNEVPIALERGVIECGVTGALSGYLAGWSEIATHFYPLPVGGWDPVGIIMNGETWSSLNEPTQNLIRQEFAKFENLVWGDAEEATEIGIVCNTGGDCPYGDAEDLALVEVSEAGLKHAREVTQADVLPSWAQRCSEECIETWNETVGDVLGIRAASE